MKHALSAIAAVATGFALSGCSSFGETTETSAARVQMPPAAPPVPQMRAHAEWQKRTGIDGTAVAAVSGDPALSYIYYDPIAANAQAVAAAPARLCGSYGRQLASSYQTYPADHEPGVKALAVICR